MSWERAVCIPACREWAQLPHAIASLARIAPANTLLVLVVNASVDATAETHLENQHVISWLKEFPHRQQADNRWLIAYPQLDIVLIDHATESFRLPTKTGVGLARDIGAQWICSLHQQGLVAQPWIWNTDADARFPKDYLDIPAHRGTCIVPYTHTGPTPQEAMPTSLEIYEYSLRYYSLGLHFARSPYAYPAIGSTIVIDVETYQKSHGFPNRMAGEDFYLLAKAAKVAPITYLKRSPILLMSRASDRVPFGTGKGMQDIADNNLEKALYHPQIFQHLRTWIETLNTVSDDVLCDRLETLAPGFPPLRKLSKLLRQKAKGERVYTRRHEWFDAFRTLKWVHYMRDSQWGTLPYEQALKEAHFISINELERSQWSKALQRQEEAVITTTGLARFPR